MKTYINYCRHCKKQYSGTNVMQRYCSDVCRQQGYYARHGIERIRVNTINPRFTANNTLSGINDVNIETKEIPMIKPAETTPIQPLFENNVKTPAPDNFGAILEQMNKTHQAQMEAMETRLKLSFAQERHIDALNSKEAQIKELQETIKEKESKSNIDTAQLISGLSNVVGGLNINDLLKTKS